MKRVGVYLPDQQAQSVERLASRLEVPASELFRRMVDFCLPDPRLDQMVPSMSGRVTAAFDPVRRTA